MIKVYETLQQYIANNKRYFTIPGVVKLSYKHHALQLWEAEVKIYSDNIAVKFIDEWSWMDVYDSNNNYVGLYKVKHIGATYENGTKLVVYSLVHAFSTMLDDAFLLTDTGILAEHEFDSLNSVALIEFMFSKQSTPHWRFTPIAYSGDTTSIRFERQNGLLKYVYDALEEMGGKYSMIFDTTEYPWKARIIEAKDKVDCRVREEYNLLKYSMDQDYAPYYNRLYVYGEKDILGAPIENKREPIKEPEITSKMTQKQIDAAWKRYHEAIKKREEDDAKRIADDKAAWEKYNADYKAWSEKQIEMQETRDAALEKRRADIASGAEPSGGYFANLPPRPSTVPPPEKPNLKTRETGTMGMSFGGINDGKPYIEDAEEIARHGIVSRVLEFKDIKDPQLLLDTAKRIFDSRQARTIDLQLTAIELNKILEKQIPFDDFHLGQHLLMQTKDLGNLDLVIVGEGKSDVYSNPYDVQLEIVEVGGSAGVGSKPHVVSPTDMMLKKIQDLQKDILYARKSADGKNTIYTGEVEPVAPEINDIWYKTIVDPVTGKTTTEMYIWNGVIWVNPFENLKQAMKQVEENEKELDILREEAEKSAKELEENLEQSKKDLMKDAAANRETINQLNKELETKLADLQTSIDNANAAAEKAVEEAQKLLSGNIDQLKTELTKKIVEEAENVESKLLEATDKKIATAKDDLLAKAKEIGNGVKAELNTQIGELSATIAETKKQADGLSTKVSEVKQTVDGFSARLLESEETSKSNKTKIAQIQNSVDSLSSTLSDVTKTTEGMETRLTTVEQTSTELKTLIKTTQENLGGKISNLNSRIDTAEGSIAKIEKTTSDNSGSITKLNKRVSTAESNITSISNNVDGLTTKTNTIQSTVDTNKATIASQKKEIDSAGEKITTLTSSLTQTQGQVSGIISNYAKKTDLKGLATEEYTLTQINAKAGEINQTISSQKKEIGTTIAGIKARPTYTIGSDGYWYKDGKKTDTMAKGVDGKDGHTLIVNTELVGSFRNHMSKGIRRVASATYDGESITLDNNNTVGYFAWGNGNWIKTSFTDSEYGDRYRDYDYIADKIVVTYKGLTAEAIARLDNINDGDDGKDAHLYTGTEPPADTKQMWFNPDNMTTYVYLDGKWVDMDKVTKHQIETNIQTINTLKQTDESIKSEIAQIKTSAQSETNKLNTLERDLNGTKSTVSTLTKDLTSAKASITSNTTQITQANNKIQTIVSDYAKKTDLNGYITESRLSTVVDQKAGEITTTLSKEIEAANKNAGVGNLLLDGDTKITNSTQYMFKAYQLAEAIPEGSIVSFVIRIKGKRDPNQIMPYNSGGMVHAFRGVNIEPDNNSDAEFKTYVLTGKWLVKDASNNTLDVHFGSYGKSSYAPVSVEWAKLVYGSNPSLTFTPSQSSITTTINTTKQTVDSMSSKIAKYDNYNNGKGVIDSMNLLERDLKSTRSLIDNKDYMSAINQQAGEIIFNVLKRGDGSVASGILRITSEGSFMDKSYIETAHISDASVTNAKIKSLSADKITAGTIDARQIRVINIDAANITTGTISGSRSFWNLNTGMLQNGWTADDVPSWMADSTYTSVQMKDGVFTFRNKGKKFVVLDDDGLQFWGEQYDYHRDKTPKDSIEADAMNETFGQFTARWWDAQALKDASGNDTFTSALGVKNLSMSHMRSSTMTISYFDKSAYKYYPYIIFDYYKKLPFVNSPITVSEDITFKHDIKTANGLVIKPLKFETMSSKNRASSIFLGSDGGWGLLISPKGLWWIRNSNPYNESGASADERKASMLRLNSTGDTSWDGGAWSLYQDY